MDEEELIKVMKLAAGATGAAGTVSYLEHGPLKDVKFFEDYPEIVPAGMTLGGVLARDYVPKGTEEIATGVAVAGAISLIDRALVRAGIDFI